MKKKLYVVSLMILILIYILSINVSALSFTTTMTPSNTKIEPGTEVVVSVKISSLEVGDDGINTFSAVLGYDASIFETLTETNVEGSNDWKSAYATGTGRITLTKTSYANSDQEIMQITLKVKADAAEGKKGTISLTNILAASPESEIGGSNVSTTITVGNESSSSTEEPNTNSTTNEVNNNTTNETQNIITPVRNITTNNTNNGTVGITNDTNNVVENQVDGDMPYTGSESTAIIQIIIGIIIIALLLYRKIYSLEDV